MSGPISDTPVHVCRVPGCRTIWVADPNIWEDIARCPKCGSDSYDIKEPEGEGGAGLISLDLGVTPPVIPPTIPYATIVQTVPLDISHEVLSGTVTTVSVLGFWDEYFSDCPVV
jgi:hypothetical protein